MTVHMGPPDNDAGPHGEGAGRVVEALGGGCDASILTHAPGKDTESQYSLCRCHTECRAWGGRDG
jgi:hypothetical protein